MGWPINRLIIFYLLYSVEQGSLLYCYYQFVLQNKPSLALKLWLPKPLGAKYVYGVLCVSGCGGEADAWVCLYNLDVSY